MGFYRKYMLPGITHFTCGLKPMMKQREKVVPLAAGRVLEIGFGTGLNLPYYLPGRVEHLWGLDPSREMLALAEKQGMPVDFDVEFIEAPAESIPLDRDSADSVVITYTLCTIPDVLSALAEARRVLRPDGRLIFCEHGASPDRAVRRWQDALTPAWKIVGGGCHLNRKIRELLEQGGFVINHLETMYIPGWKPACFNYWGTAKPA
jgi:ubiquinone/menaquinone biosynthesis C-methylase UbiE